MPNSRKKLKDLLNTKLDKVQQTKLDLKKEVCKQNKIRNLQWAIEHADYGSFQFVHHNVPINDSTKTVQKILFTFKKGCGSYISNACSVRKPKNVFSEDNDDDEEEDRLSRTRFRDQLSQQIEMLTGVKPRFKLDEKDGRYIIYYS